MEKKLLKTDVNYFSIVGKLIENPKKGILKNKVYCDLTLLIKNVNTPFKVRAYGTKAEELPLRLFQNDLVMVKGMFIETAVGVEKVVSKVDKLFSKKDFEETESDFKEIVKLYSPSMIDKRKVLEHGRKK